MLHLCEEKSLQKPSCYQGDYNLVTRGMEAKLLPILRAHGMTFNAFRWVKLRLLADQPYSGVLWRRVGLKLTSAE